MAQAASSIYSELQQEVGESMSKQLKNEAEAISMIVVVGETGAGKSYFINAISPGSCKTSARLDSCRCIPQPHGFYLAGS
jgi:predicted GTPase